MQGKAITPISAGGFLIGGTSSPGSSFPDAYLLEIDSKGDSVCSWTFGSAWTDEIRDVREVSPGHFVASGHYSGAPFMFEFTIPRSDHH